MTKQLIRIEKILKGTAQLFTAMDKGFAKVESDHALLTKFRTICYQANLALENQLPVLHKHIEATQQSDTKLFAVDGGINRVLQDLYTIKSILSENIIQVSDYIDDFSDLWKKSFSLSALLKFKLLLINEYTLLDRETESLELEQVRQLRQNALNLHDNVVKSTFDAGSKVHIEN